MSARNFSMHNKFGGVTYHPTGGTIKKAPRKAAMTAHQIDPAKNATSLAGTEKISKTGFWYTTKKGEKKWKEMGNSYGKRRPKASKKSNIVPSKL